MNTIIIPQGRLADDAAVAAKRAELKRKLLEGGKITLKKDGNATGAAGEASSGGRHSADSPCPESPCLDAYAGGGV